jgi:DNA-binding transcriptional MerR regulator
MDKITISQAAKIFGVNKKTLMRWEADKIYIPEREPLSDIRYYDEFDVRQQAFWWKLRVRHKTHNRKLTAIRAECDKYLATQPLGPMDKPKFHKLEDMKKAYDALHEWEEEHNRILQEYAKLPRGFKAKVDPR